MIAVNMTASWPANQPGSVVLGELDAPEEERPGYMMLPVDMREWLGRPAGWWAATGCAQ